MRYFVTGCAGFIGSNLTDYLLNNGDEVVGFDNCSTGRLKFLDNADKAAKFSFVRGDLLKKDDLKKALKKVDFVFHCAANADVRFGIEHPHKDLEQNTIATFNLLEAMRAENVHRIGFASTGSIYGEAAQIPTPENAAFPIQTSLYGASKLAAEGLIQAYCEGFGFQGYIFRFVSILGERYTHGHVFDFYQQLILHPEYLTILGDGKQKKSYLYIQDCLKAMICAIEKANDKINIFNLGTDEYCEVNDSIHWICEYLNLNPKREYTGGDRGWIGDNPFIFLDCSRIRKLDWEPELSIHESVVRTVQYLHQNQWLFQNEKIVDAC